MYVVFMYVKMYQNIFLWSNLYVHYCTYVVRKYNIAMSFASLSAWSHMGVDPNMEIVDFCNNGIYE